ncbi:MAG: hypothetical protein IV107_22505 [Paucibacter sp.]|nr:hypothetical protein [Roseateles sp.]
MPQLQTWRSWIWNAGAFLFFAGLAISALFTGAVYLFAVKPGICTNTSVVEVKSPNGKKLAKLGYRECGGTTNWQSGVSITDVSSGETYSGLFGLNGRPDGLSLFWKNEYTLVVSGFDLESVLWLKQDNSSGVALVLRP